MSSESETKGNNSIETPGTISPLTFRESTSALAVLLVAAAVCFHPLVLHPTALLVGPQRHGENDLTSQFIPFRDFPARQIVQEKGAPYWNPYSFAGTPLIGNPQSSQFYPPNWIYLFLPTLTAISWIMVGHHVWGGLGTFIACRAFGFRWGAAVVAGVIFMVSPYFVAQLGEGHYNQVCVASWLPWGLWAYDRFRVAPHRNAWLLILVLVAGFACGHVQELYYLVLTLSGFLLVDLVQLVRSAQKPNAKRLFLHWVLVLGFTFGLTAIELFPIVAYATQSVRSGGMSAEEVGGINLNNLLELWNPMIHGGPTVIKPPMFYWETVCHFGIVPLLLAVVGVWLGRRVYPVPRIVVAALICFWFAFGADNPVFRWGYAVVPGMSRFRAPSRIFFFVSLCVAVLAAAGLDLLARWHATRVGSNASINRNWPRAFFSAIAALASLVGGLMVCGLFKVSTEDLLATLWLAAGLAILAATFWVKSSERWTWIACVVICVAELGTHATTVLRFVPRENIRRDNRIANYLSEKTDWDRVLAKQDLLSDWEAWSHQLFKAQSYEPVPPTRYAIAFDALTKVRPEKLGQWMLGFEDLPLAGIEPRFASLMGVRYLVSRPQEVPPDSSWKMVEQGTVPIAFRTNESGDSSKSDRSLPFQIFENSDVFPRAFIVGRARRFDGKKQNPAAALSTVDFRQEVLLETDDVLPRGPRSPFEPAEIVEYSSRRVVIEAELRRPGYLVLTDMWSPGWRATVDGQDTQVLSANVAFRAVPLTPGKHRVEFVYRPPGLTMGLLTSLVSFVVLLILQFRRPGC